jgi:hypothetical protein
VSWHQRTSTPGAALGHLPVLSVTLSMDTTFVTTCMHRCGGNCFVTTPNTASSNAESSAVPVRGAEIDGYTSHTNPTMPTVAMGTPTGLPRPQEKESWWQGGCHLFLLPIHKVHVIPDWGLRSYSRDTAKGTKDDTQRIHSVTAAAAAASAATSGFPFFSSQPQPPHRFSSISVVHSKTGFPNLRLA